jgi:hypothetical protein
MHYLKKSIVLLCLMAFVISTTGISVQMHSCRMTGKTKVAVLPEIFGAANSCCNMQTSGHSKDNCSLDQIPCCKTGYTYAKVASWFSQSFSIKNFNSHFLNLPLAHLLNISLKEAPQKSSFSDYQPPPLLFFGTSLLHFIHNIKIALPY